MAIRTTESDVATLLGDDYNGTTSLTRSVAMASKLVDRMITCAANKVPAITFDSTELEQIEALVAAHFYQMADPGYTSRSTMSASGSFRGQFTRKLDATAYGQNAMLMDVSGCLENFDKRQSAGMSWLGKADPDKLTYAERNE